MKHVLTIEQALQATSKFLQFYYLRTCSHDIGSFLSDMTIIHSKMTADPAAWHDWLDAVRLALKFKASTTKAEIEQQKLSFLNAYKAMRLFVRAYSVRTSSEDIPPLLERMKLTTHQKTKQLIIWQEWLNAIQLIALEAEIINYEDCIECQEFLKTVKNSV